MPSTPGSGINKNLLTPCRRVGLSRKRKTPNSIVKIYSDLNCSNASIGSINDSPVIDTTPVNHRKSLSRRKHESFQQFHCSSSPLTILPIDSGSEKQLKTDLETLQEYNDSDKSKKESLFDRFSSEDLFDSSKNKSPKNAITGTSKKIFKDDPIEKLKKEISADESIGTKDSVDENRGSPLACSLEVIKTNISRKSRRRLSDDDFLNLENVSVKDDKSKKPKKTSSFDVENEVIDDSDEDFRIISKCDSKRKQRKMEETKYIKKSKRIKKTLSIKKSSLSFTDDEFDTDISKKVIPNDDVKECQIQIQRLSEDSVCLSETNANNNDNPPEKLVRKRNVTIVDDDDDDAFTFTPEQEKNEKKNLVKKIKTLEDQIRKKQQKFANLKQASIYKTKHDVEGLKQLTSQWINGCVLGLNDLLEQLQAHGPMSMTTLINNLHISSEMVAKLPLNID